MAFAQPPTRSGQIVEQIYDCVARPSRWSETLDALRVEVGGRIAVIGVVESETRTTRLSVATGETGLVHISQIAHEFVRSVSDFLQEGQEITVKVLGRDEKGRLDLSIKELQDEPEEIPRPKRIGKQAPAFEAKLRSFMRDAKERQPGAGGDKKKKGPRK